MKKERKSATGKHYLICAMIATAIVGILFYTEGLFTGGAYNLRALYRILSDSFGIPAALMLCAGGAVFFYQLGAFDSLIYIAKQFAGSFNRDKRRQTHVQTFAEFVEARDAAEKAPCQHFIIVGAVFLVVSMVFLVLNCMVA